MLLFFLDDLFDFPEHLHFIKYIFFYLIYLLFRCQFFIYYCCYSTYGGREKKCFTSFLVINVYLPSPFIEFPLIYFWDWIYKEFLFFLLLISTRNFFLKRLLLFRNFTLIFFSIFYFNRFELFCSTFCNLLLLFFLLFKVSHLFLIYVFLVYTLEFSIKFFPLIVFYYFFNYIIFFWLLLVFKVDAQTDT